MTSSSHRFAVLLLLILSAVPPSAGQVPELESLGLEERIGQMVFPRLPGTLLTEDDPRFREVADLVREGRVGGVVLFGGDPLSAASTIRRLQELARVPLLVGLDAEWGTGMRFEGGLDFPVAMAMGAADDPSLVEEVGRWTAREAMALGIHLILAPVLDLAVEPDNRVIGTRSFGSDPQRVGRLGAAFVRGVQDEGALAVVKHFPGHGATVEDSHYALPRLRASEETLFARELVPFVAAVEAGVDGVMPAHLVVEALDDDSTPASRSVRVLNDVLRERLAFDGLIVSDALDMEGARGEWHGSVVVDAVAAGTDVLLLPPVPRVAVDALLDAVRRGEISPERIDASARRILAQKRAVGLVADAAPPAASARREVVDARDEGRMLQERIARAAVTWLDDGEPADGGPGDCLGGRAGSDPCWRGSVVVVSLFDEHDRRPVPRQVSRAIHRRAAGVRELRVRPTSVEDRAEEIEAAVDGADALLVASYASRRSWGPLSGEDEVGESDPGAEPSPWSRVRSWIDRGAERGIPTVFATLGDPWTLELEAPERLGVFDRSDASQRALVQALYGEIPIGGIVPVALALAAEDDGAPAPSRSWAPVEWRTEAVDDPRTVGMERRTARRLRRVLEEAVADGAFPGAVGLVARRGRVVFHEAVGHLTYEEEEAATVGTLYDLASLTKVVVTTTLAMILEERGVLDLSAPVQRYLPEFTGPGKELVEVVDLLTHSSGTLWWTDLYLRHGERSTPSEEVEDAYLGEIYELPLESEPRTGTEYSDLGILLFGEILERVTGRDLRELARLEIFDPLGMDRTGYRPTEPPLSAELGAIAPTELDPWRGEIVRGEVHDENAAGLGGVAPHAGVFSTAEDLGRFLQMLLQGGHLDGVRLVRPSTVERFVRRAERVADSSRAIGWDTPSGNSTAGRYFSEGSFGHTGFTGTSLWVDPERGVIAVLLTNRVHPTRENRRISDVRRAFHDAVMLAIEDVEISPRPGAPAPER